MADLGDVLVLWHEGFEDFWRGCGSVDSGFLGGLSCVCIGKEPGLGLRGRGKEFELRCTDDRDGGGEKERSAESEFIGVVIGFLYLTHV